MSGHHGGGCPVVGQAGRLAPHTVATCRIAHQIHTVGVHTLAGHHQAYEFLIQLVDGFLAPHVPGVPRGTGSHIHSLLGLIEPLLIVPLPVVHLLRHSPAAMQRDPQRARPHRSRAIDGVPEGHRGPLGADGTPSLGLREYLAPHLALTLHPLSNHSLLHTAGSLAREALTGHYGRRTHQPQKNQKDGLLHSLDCFQMQR